MTPTNEQIRTAVAEQAADWFVTNRSGSLSDKDRIVFIDWLRTSPVHVEEYLGVAAIGRDLPAAAAELEVPPESVLAEASSEGTDNVTSLGQLTPMRDTPVSRWWPAQGWRLAAPAAAVAALLIAVVAFWPRGGESLGVPKTYETAHSGQNAWQLPDGTMVRLNAESAITVRFTGAERTVEVARGQAFFEVAHDVRRRFRVAAGKADVVALGTQFDVYRQGETTIVTVAEGQVAVFTADMPPPGPGIALPAGAISVSARQQIRVRSGVVTAPPAAVDLQQAEAWLHRQIIFEQRPLGEVADEFNRYAPVPFDIEDPSLRAALVSGVFNAYDTDSFTAFLQALDGVSIEKTPTRVRVIVAPPATREAFPKGRQVPRT